MKKFQVLGPKKVRIMTVKVNGSSNRDLIMQRHRRSLPIVIYFGFLNQYFAFLEGLAPCNIMLF